MNTFPRKICIGWFIGVVVGFALAYGLSATGPLAFLCGLIPVLAGSLIGARLENGN